MLLVIDLDCLDHSRVINCLVRVLHQQLFVLQEGLSLALALSLRFFGLVLLGLFLL